MEIDIDELDGNQIMTWVINQAIRNELEVFHGGGAYDPENPGRGEVLITDKQMKALNIVIRHYGAVSAEDAG